MGLTSICEVWRIRVGIQVYRKELHTYIHLDYVKVYMVLKKKTFYMSRVLPLSIVSSIPSLYKSKATLN